MSGMDNWLPEEAWQRAVSGRPEHVVVQVEGLGTSAAVLDAEGNIVATGADPG